MAMAMSMNMKLYNTLTRRKEDFAPLQDGHVRMYVCGPTVYDYFHIGNARPFIVFDAFRRYLEEVKGWRVTYVMNITDIEDKIINRAAAEGLPAEEVARRYTEAFFEDLDRLGVRRATHHPKATEYIPQMIALVQKLVEKGYAYEVEGDVYFRVRRFPDYGKLSKKPLDELESGARVAVDERKEDPADFALWKAAKPDEPRWESPWGPGRPGWHLECSVMGLSLLGETFDIHTGGQDLIFPHHENEIAQAEAATGKPFARFWLHNGMLQFEGEKMSKSLGNFEYARDVVDRYGPEAVRLFYLSKHYRSPVNFTPEALAEAQRAVERAYTLMEEAESAMKGRPLPTPAQEAPSGSEAGREFAAYLETVRPAFLAALDDDFNTAEAVGVLFELVRRANAFRRHLAEEDLHLLRRAVERLRELGGVLGLFQGRSASGELGPLQDELIELLVEVRNELRARREFQLADHIRDRLAGLGIQLKDKPEGTLWHVSGVSSSSSSGSGSSSSS